MSDRVTILLVESEATIRLFLSSMLETLGHTIVGASSCERALDVLRARSIDLILMAIKSGKVIEGVKAGQTILRDHEIPLVFLMSYDEKNAFESVGAVAPYGYVIKGSGAKGFDAAITKALKLHGKRRKISNRDNLGKVNGRGQAKTADAAARELNAGGCTVDAIRESERIFRSIFDTSIDGIIVAEAEGHVVAVNQRTCEMFGLPAKDFLQLPRGSIVRDDDNLRAALAERQRTGRSRAELTAIKPDGSTFPIEVSSSVFVSEDGKKMVTLVIRDITQRKEVEDTFRLSEALFRSLVEATSDCVWGLDPDGSFMYASPKLKELLGYTVAELIGKKPSDFMSPDRVERAERLFGEAEKSRAPFSGREGLLVHKDGRRVMIEASGAPAFDRAGNFAGYWGFIRDITDRKRTEEALRDSEEKYRNVFAAESDALFLTDLESRTILEVNNAACALYGMTEEELKHGNMRDIVVEHDELVRAINNRSTRVSGRLHRKRDGTIFPVDISASFFALKGRPVVLGAVRDITELRSAKEELEIHREQLEALVEERTGELKAKSKAVKELNVALKVLLHQVQEDKEHLEQRFVANVNGLVLPYVDKLRKSRLDEQQKSHLGIIESNLNEIMSPFLHYIQQLNLTPRETQVASLIKDGKTTKEIAEVIGVAPDAVNSYRNSIRLKLGLNNKKVNLQSYLQSFK